MKREILSVFFICVFIANVFAQTTGVDAGTTGVDLSTTGTTALITTATTAAFTTGTTAAAGTTGAGPPPLKGTVTVVPIQSTALGFTRNLQIYTPPGFHPNGTTRYPVVYFLHGFTGNHLSFGFLNDVVDALIVNGSVVPLIIVKPDGSINKPGAPLGSLWANSALNGKYEDFLLQEVIPYIDSHYPTDARREKRFLMGHSFGASGSVRLALQNLDIFGSCASHSGFVQMDASLVQYYVNVSVINENNRSANIVPAGFAKIFTLFVFTGAQAWSPDFTKPLNVSLPFINDGSAALNQSVVALWESFSPHVVIQNRLAAYNSKKFGVFYTDIGSRDELELLPPNLNFAGLLFNLGVDHVIKIYDGPHNDPNLLRGRFTESVTLWSNYVRTLDPITPAPTIVLETPFPYGLTFGIIGGFIALVVILGILAYVGVKRKWHIIMLPKKGDVSAHEADEVFS